MKPLFITLLAGLALISCSKKNTSRVEIYLLTSFQYKIDTSRYPATTSIINPVLAPAPLIADKDIYYYKPAEYGFMLTRDIRSEILNFGPSKAFAVVVDDIPVYYGKFHPAYLSSISVGIATIDPVLMQDNYLRIGYVQLSSGGSVADLDKRNDQRLLSALAASGRLK